MREERSKLLKAVCWAWLAIVAMDDSRFAAQQIVVGQNAQVSSSQPKRTHTEVRIASDPGNPQKLIAASMISKETGTQTIVYASTDGGKTWRQTLESDRYGTASADPDVAFGPDGTAYYTALIKPEVAPRARLFLFRSADGGESWSEPTIISGLPFFDRPYLVAAATDGKYKGRLYISVIASNQGTDNQPLPLNFILYRSDNQGAQFDPPAWRTVKDRTIQHPGNIVTLSDGTLVAAYREFVREAASEMGPSQYGIITLGEVKNDPARPNNQIVVIRSEDGGVSLTPAVPVADSYLYFYPRTISTFPNLAADRSTTLFRDRIYMVWNDSYSGRSQIMLSHSSDKGKTWSAPKAVNDDAPFEAPLKGPDDYMPVVAVNRDGVVGVMWYDRRDNPDNAGWYIRFAASTDGGDTFGPSVRVSELPMTQDPGRWPLSGRTVALPRPAGSPLEMRVSLGLQAQFSGGDTAGLEADATGVFHPLWVDNRTGVVQVWTAPVRVKGRAIVNGSEELSRLEDLSAMSRIDFTGAGYDAETGTVTLEAQLVNTSKATFRSPIKARVLSVSTELARAVEITNADNRMTGPGAVWDFTDTLMNGELKPGEKSRMKRFSFHLTGLLKIDRSQLNKFLNLAVRMEARVLGSTTR